MNLKLEVEVTKEEMKVVLASFKKAKILGLDGWTIEFFFGFYDMLEGYLLENSRGENWGSS